MAKAMLIMDMPSCCKECDFALDSLRYCTRKNESISKYRLREEKPEWCPLREAPKKIVYTEGLSQSKLSEVKGYNTCIDEILGGSE